MIHKWSFPPTGRGFPVRNMFVLYCAPNPAYKAGLAGALPVISHLDTEPFKLRKLGIPLIKGKMKKGKRVYVSVG